MNISTRALFKQLVSTSPYQPATNYWRSIELAVLAAHGLPRGRVLDLGCGDGKLTSILAATLEERHRIIWTGADPDQEETSLASGLGLYQTVHTCNGDQIPETTGSFDAVLSNSVLEHIPAIEPVTAEVARLLRPGGRYIFTVPTNTFHECLAGPLFGPRSADYLRSLDRRCAHERYWSIEDWTDHLAPHGLHVTYHRHYLSGVQTRRWERLSNATGGLLYRLGGGIERPIQIQRTLRMRRSETSPVDRLMAKLSPIAILGAPLNFNEQDGLHSCLLVEAEKN